ncbi:single-stranded-DNA-specific exonuclease RecJ [Helicobacter sp.]|uniref:single-stranded-DNA-specific exonuclease RecJ n=1 Tax=Helicobacter sp. TaxID=218 RepID=UPI0019C39970|nr:single-stranded-DNA-specific exonuclease RecJ [Helicobacter sp.]MBD5165835.1 single-stranded-DNA-specific exonuclease RecJ [Helicobacter sp.]
MIPHLDLLDIQAIEAKLAQRFAEDTIVSLKDLPLPKCLENLPKIAQRIAEAIRQNKRIVVVGDYDVDGVVSCAILYEFFKKLHYPIKVEIPNRFLDGYGLSASVISRLDCEMIITVDNGINAIEAAEICRERGIELIITDHHTPQEELPQALICNPKLSSEFPEPEICGACVAWYLCAALKNEMQSNVSMVEFLDLLALAIVSDVMPLRGINRVLLKKGLEVLRQSKRIALLGLKEHFSKYNLDAQLISYYIAPLLNCAGRMENALLAYHFLIADNFAESKQLLKKLLDLNAKRKTLQNTIYEEAKAMFCAQENHQNLPFVLVFHQSWHEGIIGIIAARLSEEFLKPSIVLTLKDGILKGSMRSINVDCMQVLEASKEYLIAFGGHIGAAGLSLGLENLENFKQRLMKLEYQQTIPAQESYFKEVLGRLPLDLIDVPFFQRIQNFEPFGQGNALPKFYTEALIIEVRYFGAGHSSVRLQENQSKQNALVFFQDLRESVGKKIGCIYSLQWDKYNHNVVLNLEHYEFL